MWHVYPSARMPLGFSNHKMKQFNTASRIARRHRVRSLPGLTSLHDPCTSHGNTVVLCLSDLTVEEYDCEFTQFIITRSRIEIRFREYKVGQSWVPWSTFFALFGWPDVLSHQTNKNPDLCVYCLILNQ